MTGHEDGRGWTSTRSMQLSLVAVRSFLVLLALAAASAPFWVKWYVLLREFGPQLHTALLVALYCCCPPGFYLLLCLDRLLQNLLAGQVFIHHNVQLLRRISWCCYLAAAITLAASFWYLPFLVIAAAAGFMGLVLRVVKNVFDQAIYLQTEVDYTI